MKEEAEEEVDDDGVSGGIEGNSLSVDEVVEQTINRGVQLTGANQRSCRRE